MGSGFLWGILVLCIVVTYLQVPLQVRKQFWLSDDPQIIPLDREDAAEVSGDYLDEAAGRLSSLGFEETGRYQIARMEPRGVQHASFLSGGHDRRDIAHARVVLVEHGAAVRLHSRFVQFFTRFADGTQLCTDNFPVAPFWTVPGRQLHRLPMVVDLEALYRVHCLLVERCSAVQACSFPAGLDMVAQFRASLVAEFAGLVETGFLERRSGEAVYRLRVRSAYPLIWGLLWPGRAIRRILMHRRGWALLRELGMEDARR